MMNGSRHSWHTAYKTDTFTLITHSFLCFCSIDFFSLWPKKDLNVLCHCLPSEFIFLCFWVGLPASVVNLFIYESPRRRINNAGIKFMLYLMMRNYFKVWWQEATLFVYFSYFSYCLLFAM